MRPGRLRAPLFSRRDEVCEGSVAEILQPAWFLKRATRLELVTLSLGSAGEGWRSVADNRVHAAFGVGLDAAVAPGFALRFDMVLTHLGTEVFYSPSPCSRRCSSS